MSDLPSKPKVWQCQLCYRRIYKCLDGYWRHDHNASVKCRLGESRKAIPLHGAKT